MSILLFQTSLPLMLPVSAILKRMGPFRSSRLVSSRRLLGLPKSHGSVKHTQQVHRASLEWLSDHGLSLCPTKVPPCAPSSVTASPRAMASSTLLYEKNPWLAELGLMLKQAQALKVAMKLDRHQTRLRQGSRHQKEYEDYLL